MNYLTCKQVILPLRSEPGHRFEQCSQLLFGENAVLLEEKAEWWHIRSVFDSYEGWVEQGSLMPVSGLPDNISIVSKPLVRALKGKEAIYLPAGSEIADMDDKLQFTFCGERYQLKETPFIDTSDPILTALQFLNAPYLWGGRSLMGIDCSGFVQLVYKLMSCPLPRDAFQQIHSGIKIDSLSDSRKGDLAFFENHEGKITHVGLIMEHYKIIHASKSVRIDKIDNQGIYNEELTCYTHNLHSLRRLQ